ncbi:hypothetical protein CAG99_10160 [Streptomyces marincola]|uniref:Transposase IS701-like DDE domain-containing protein n=1 Tax=Streptomyces marincola TaxID=2878388 RepID=A0A1W7CWK4_9ACTN|nr:hypothetical protein CAG99_10160 [Streptomyces marincola]
MAGAGAFAGEASGHHGDECPVQVGFGVLGLVDLALAPEHRRGHGALYGGLNQGRIDVARLRRALAGVPLPRAADGWLVLAVDVSPWLRPDANTSAYRAFCTPSAGVRASTRWCPAGLTPWWPRWRPAAPPGRQC